MSRFGIAYSVCLAAYLAVVCCSAQSQEFTKQQRSFIRAAIMKLTAEQLRCAVNSEVSAATKLFCSKLGTSPDYRVLEILDCIQSDKKDCPDNPPPELERRPR
jgi:hypothetical protein